ncbi:ROK family protein [Murimonas intestini]|uniref:ROK family protein n=1 Tax=Murimonas intestini TaxID=1337051 RepID=UPI0011DE5551|nr:ROK family protein [Murimonas intestini]
MKVLVIDIGGTSIKYACMKEDMTILTRGKMDTPKENREQLIETIGKIYDEMPDVEGIAISMPGIIDSENGYCAMGGALRYNDDFYLRHSLYQRCPVKIYMENDAKCAAMAEAAVGSLKDVQDGFVLIFGTMIGGGFVKDHRLHKGKHFSAGEVSYNITVRNGKPTYEDVWGNRCGTPRLCRMYAEKKGLNPDEVDGVMVFNAVNQKDKDAEECLRKYTKEIAVQLFNIQTTLDPERFAIGGGISAQPVFIEYIKNSLKELYADCIYHVPQAEVVSCKFQNDANLIGALQCFLEFAK